MTRLRKIIKLATSLSIVLVAGYGGYLVLASLTSRFLSLSENVIAAFVASLTAVFGYWYTQRQSKSRDIAEAHRPKKIEVYGTFMDLLERFADVSSADKLGELEEGVIPEELRKQFMHLNRGLILWGSPSMIKSWSIFKMASQLRPDGRQVLLMMDDVLRAIREDLGNSNAGLKRGDLIKMFLRDPSELDQVDSSPSKSR